MLERFQCNDWGGGEKDKLELDLVRERCKLAASIADFGWRFRGQSFKPLAVQLHDPNYKPRVMTPEEVKMVSTRAPLQNKSLQLLLPLAGACLHGV